MCGIAGIINIKKQYINNLIPILDRMGKLQQHRGPDQTGYVAKSWYGLTAQRLKIIDLTTGNQPLVHDDTGCIIIYNGEIYNYQHLKKQLIKSFNFKTTSDTEVILAAYLKHGVKCLNLLDGMFSFVIYDPREESFFIARDRIGIKPFYYTIKDNLFFFASEIKTLLPFIDVTIDSQELNDYLVFQFSITNKSLFKNIEQLLPGHYISIKNNNILTQRYWNINYNIDLYKSDKYFIEKLENIVIDETKKHLQSDVKIACYLSGGLDSGLLTTLVAQSIPNLTAYHGYFPTEKAYDESQYAKTIANLYGINLICIPISPQDVVDNLEKIIYTLDVPLGGTGSILQYLTAKQIKEKVVIGGQGGDELFGGYVRYLIAYFEQVLKHTIFQTASDENRFIVHYNTIAKSLQYLKNYFPLLQKALSINLFGEMDTKYLVLLDRTNSHKSIFNLQNVDQTYERAKQIFNSNNFKNECYFDKMTHFDFKTFLPMLLHIEDRVNMAFGIESRVPFLNTNLVEFMATVPANVKFQNGELKKLFKQTFQNYLPKMILSRTDKMGAPVPFSKWAKATPLKDFLCDLFLSGPEREYYNKKHILKTLETNAEFDRELWGAVSLELWQQIFIDKRMI